MRFLVIPLIFAAPVAGATFDYLIYGRQPLTIQVDKTGMVLNPAKCGEFMMAVLSDRGAGGGHREKLTATIDHDLAGGRLAELNKIFRKYMATIYERPIEDTVASHPQGGLLVKSVGESLCGEHNQRVRTPSNVASAFSASFDCAKASTRTEKLICSDKTLAELDNALAQKYLDALKRAPDARVGLRNEQRQWLKEARDPCPNVECLAKAYRERIAMLDQRQLPAISTLDITKLTGVYKAKSGELHLISESREIVRFQITSAWKTNILDVSGKLRVANNQAQYNDAGCRLDFAFRESSVEVKQTGSCGGLNTTAAGVYVLVPGKKPKIQG